MLSGEKPEGEAVSSNMRKIIKSERLQLIHAVVEDPKVVGEDCDGRWLMRELKIQ